MYYAHAATLGSGATTFSKLEGSNSLVYVIVHNKIRMVYPVSSTFVLCSLQLRKKLEWSVQIFLGGPDPPTTQWLRP